MSEQVSAPVVATPPAKEAWWRWFLKHPVAWKNREGGDYIEAFTNLGIWAAVGLVVLVLVFRRKK